MRKRETRYSVSHFHVAFSPTISAGSGGARGENATHGVVLAPWAGVFADGSSHQPSYLISLLMMAASSTPHRWSYDLFVSFRGDDVRKGFMDHLFENFKQKGIHAFRDDSDLPRGEKISPQLDKAIKESRFLFVIFSKHYASSSWCLRELVKILERKETGNSKQEVQIIFYDVKPDVVRKQTGSYAEAFAKHKVSNRRDVDTWRKTLSIASNLSGWDLQDMTNG
ncbi:NB-ARC domains-containing protein [Tanacetum coccineum]